LRQNLNLSSIAVITYRKNCLVEPGKLHEGFFCDAVLSAFKSLDIVNFVFLVFKFFVFQDHRFYKITHLCPHALDIHVCRVAQKVSVECFVSNFLQKIFELIPRC
jgi:hypothetical protein